MVSLKVLKLNAIFLVATHIVPALFSVSTHAEIPSLSSSTSSAQMDARSPEAMGAPPPNVCMVNGTPKQNGEVCGEPTVIGPCESVKYVCVDGACKPFSVYEPEGKICKEGGPCDPHDRCDGQGTCVEKPLKPCPANTDCIKYTCDADFDAKNCVETQQEKVNAVCDEFRDPIVCGEKYWVKWKLREPAKCGGKTTCPDNYQVDAPPCGSIICTGNQSTREFGASNPAFTYVCKENDVDVTNLMTAGSFESGPSIRAPAGSTYSVPFKVKPTRVGYEVATLPAKLTVIKKPIRCKVDSFERRYGEPNPKFTFSCEPFVAPDTQLSIFGSNVPTTIAGVTSSVGSYPIDLSPPQHNDYAISVEPGVLKINKIPSSCTITPAPITTLDPVSYSKFYPTLSVPGSMVYRYSSSGTLVKEGVKLAAGSYGIRATLTPSDSGNYEPATCTGTLLVTGCGIGNISPQMTLECPNILKIVFNDIFECPGFDDRAALYRIGLDSLAFPVWPTNKGNLRSMDDVVINRSTCTEGRCSYRTELKGALFKEGMTVYAGIAAFSGDGLFKQGTTSERGECPEDASGCVERDCPQGAVFDQKTCKCKCPEVDEAGCGSLCRPAPYPKCIACEDPCLLNDPITYKTPDGQCLMATYWGPSETCCPKVGCDIGVHGYASCDQDTCLKEVAAVSACPSQKGKVEGSFWCETCNPNKCAGLSVYCTSRGPDGYIRVDNGQELKWGRKVQIIDGQRQVATDEDCHCVAKPGICPAGYELVSGYDFEVEYTPLEATGLLNGTACVR